MNFDTNLLDRFETNDKRFAIQLTSLQANGRMTFDLFFLGSKNPYANITTPRYEKPNLAAVNLVKGMSEWTSTTGVLPNLLTCGNYYNSKGHLCLAGEAMSRNSKEISGKDYVYDTAESESDAQQRELEENES